MSIYTCPHGKSAAYGVCPLCYPPAPEADVGTVDGDTLRRTFDQVWNGTCEKTVLFDVPVASTMLNRTIPGAQADPRDLTERVPPAIDGHAYPVRIPADRIEELRAAAEFHDVRPRELIAEVVLDWLDQRKRENG